MDIEDNTVTFRTNPDMYEKKKTGINNIAKALTDSEFKWFYENHHKINLICIRNSQNGEKFTRKIIDVSRDYFTARNHDTVDFLTFTWEHSDSDTPAT